MKMLSLLLCGVLLTTSFQARAEEPVDLDVLSAAIDTQLEDLKDQEQKAEQSVTYAKEWLNDARGVTTLRRVTYACGGITAALAAISAYGFYKADFLVFAGYGNLAFFPGVCTAAAGALWGINYGLSEGNERVEQFKQILIEAKKELAKIRDEKTVLETQ